VIKKQECKYRGYDNFLILKTIQKTITMKKLIYLAVIVFFFFTSCEDLGIGGGNDSTLNGKTDIPINTVGNEFSTIGFSVNGTWVEFDPQMVITKSADGVNTIKITADLSTNSTLQKLNNLIPASLKDAQGKVNFEMKVKVTDKGWLDYSNVDEEPCVLVKYDGKVGDKYSVTTSSGTKIEREITYKSSDDDYAYGFMEIKVIKVEQETSFPGIQKYVMYFNHKFGFVGFEVIAEDGTSINTSIISDQY
jgi:hypothetical protein